MSKRRDVKLRKKTDPRGIEYVVFGSDFNIDRKRANEAGGGIFFEGYASIFNTPDSYKDIIKPGAFKNYNKDKWPTVDNKTGRVRSGIKSLWQHNPDWPFGLPVHLEEDSTGLFHRTQISATKENEDRVTYMEDTVVEGESIGFMTLDAEWEEEDEDEMWPIRYLKGIDLWEISPVTFAAHNDAVTTLVKRNRELMLAVKSADHARVLETATHLKGVTVPAVEEALATLTQVATLLKSQEEADDSETEANAEEGAEDAGETEEEAVGKAEEEGPIETGDTSEEDDVFIKGLEDFVFQMRTDRVAQSFKSRR